MLLIFVILLLRLVGRAAVTGSHEWFHSEDFSRVVHPPEVLEDIAIRIYHILYMIYANSMAFRNLKLPVMIISCVVKLR